MITNEILWSVTLTFLCPFFDCSFIHIFLFFVGTFVRPYFHSFVSTLVHSSINFLNCLQDSSFDPTFAPSSVSSLIPPSFHPFLCTQTHSSVAQLIFCTIGEKVFFQRKTDFVIQLITAIVFQNSSFLRELQGKQTLF